MNEEKIWKFLKSRGFTDLAYLGLWGIYTPSLD